MRIGKPTPLEAEYLAKLGLAGLSNFDLPDADFARHLEILRRQHGVKRHGVEHHDEPTLRARALARAAHESYGRRKLEEQAPHPYVLQMNRRLNIAIVCIIVAIVAMFFFVVKGHAQAAKANAGPAARANVWFWNGSAYVPVEAAAPLPITCNNCSGSGLSVVDNTAFTASTSPFIPIGGWYSSTPSNCADGRQCTALMTLTRHLWTTCDNCSSSSFTDLAVFTPTSTAVGFAGCFFQTTNTNNPLTNLTGGAPQCTANRELFVAFRSTPTVNIGTFANTLGVTQSTNPWVVSVPTWAGGTLGAMANYGTSPGAVLVPGMNAFVTNNVAVTLGAETTKVIGTVNQGTSPWTVAGGLTENNATPPATQQAVMPCRSDTNARAVTVTFQVLLSCDANDLLRVSLKDTPSNSNNLNVNLAAAGVTVGVTQSTNPWVGSCTAANCTSEIADGSANKFTSNSNTYSAKFGLDSNILGLDGALMSATNALFTQITDGAAAHGVMANFGVSPGGVKSLNVNASMFSGTTALGAPNTFGTTAPTGNALGVNAAQFIGTAAQINDGTAGAAGVGGHFADNGVAAATNRLPTLDCIYQTSYLNGTAATQGRNGAQSCGTDGLLWTASLPSIRPASYHWSASFAGTSTTIAAHIAGNATNTLLLTGIRASCTATTAGIPGTWTITKTSAASTGGTAATMTAIPDDSNYAAASSVAQSFTGTGPTAGTPVGQIDAYKLDCNATGTAGPNDIYISPAWMKTKPIVLRTTAQTVEVGFGGAVVGGNYTVTFEGIETSTILP